MRIKNIMNGTQPSFKRSQDGVCLGMAASVVAVIGMLTISATASADPADKTSVENQVSSVLVSGRLTSEYGEAFDPFKEGKKRWHRGLDIAAPTGTEIYAPADGVIKAATNLYDGKPAYGTVVVIETKDGTSTMLAHLDRFLVEAGQRVTKGTPIATVGNSGKSTGPHVHIETSQNGKLVDPAQVWSFEP